MMVVVKMRDYVPSSSYSTVCNVCVNGASRSSLLIESTYDIIIILKIAAIALLPSTTHLQLWAELLTFKPKCTIT